jgi:hypothetical protein
MSEARSRPGLRTGLQQVLIVLLLALAVLIVLNQANPLTTRLGRDSGMYAYVASHLMRGDTPYLSAWEHKPPGIFFIDALGLSIARGSRWGIWFMEFIFLLGAALAGLEALKSRFGTWPAVLASLAWLGGLSLVLQGGNFTEEYALLFSFASLWLFTLIMERPDSIWLHAGLGLAFGCGFLTRPNNTGVQAAIILIEVLLVILKQRPWRPTLIGLIATGIGLAIPLIGVSLYFASRNAFQAFLDGALIFGLYYGGQPDVAGALLGGLQRFGLIAGVALVGTWMAFDGVQQKARERAVDPLLLWMCVDLILEVVLSGLSGRSYTHYFISWLPWMGAACALPLRQALHSFRKWGRPLQTGAALASVLFAAWACWSMLAEYGRTFVQLAAQRGLVQRQEVLPAYVNQRTQPGDTVLVWGGDAGINFLSRRDAPTAQVAYGLLGPSPLTERFSRQFIEDVVSDPPALILDLASLNDVPPLTATDPEKWFASRGLHVAPYMREFFDFVHANYTYTTEVAGVPVYFFNR